MELILCFYRKRHYKEEEQLLKKVTHYFMWHVTKTYVDYLGQDWDIDIKIRGKILGHWYQKFHGVPIRKYCVYSQKSVYVQNQVWK